jgi:hypothetical protein
MYTLRIIEETRKKENEPFEQVTEDHSLGKSYALLKQGLTSEFEKEIESLKEELDKNWPEINIKSDVITLVCGANGEKFFVMKNTNLVQRSYFIMTENGSTLARL